MESQTWDAPYAFVMSQNGINVADGQTLTLNAGTVVKADNGTLFVNGTLDLAGNEEEGVTFTSIKDDTIAGDTNGDGEATSAAVGDWDGLRYPSVEGSEIAFASLRYADTAIDIKYLDFFSVYGTDFAHNDEAIDVAETAESEPLLVKLLCVPPYLSTVFVQESWFGPVGLPAPSIDLTEVVGATIPAEYAPLFGQTLALAKQIAPNLGLENTIPFKLYACPGLGIPPIPVSPVHILEPMRFFPIYSEP
jgi:hypothetical protein